MSVEETFGGQEKKTDSSAAVANSSNFFAQLWDSVFIPGTTPALVFATHVSFIILIVVFVVLVTISRQPLRFHFVNMLIISIVFYAVVVWFINELQNTNIDENFEKDKPQNPADKYIQEKNESKDKQD